MFILHRLRIFYLVVHAFDLNLIAENLKMDYRVIQKAVPNVEQSQMAYKEVFVMCSNFLLLSCFCC